MRSIPLTQGQTALVDEEDYEYLSQWKWHYNKDGYAKRSVKVSGKVKTVHMHKLVLARKMGQEITSKGDHRNRNTLDNTRQNLRPANDHQSSCNAVKNKVKHASKYRGVFQKKGERTFYSTIHAQGKQLYLGSYQSDLEAARAYNAAASKLHGEFAILNEVD